MKSPLLLIHTSITYLYLINRGSTSHQRGVCYVCINDEEAKEVEEEAMTNIFNGAKQSAKVERQL